jgi:hypothetical protein
MNLQLFQGHFNQQEAVELITAMIEVKIKYHERKISVGNMEEDVKMREKRITQLQNELRGVREYIEEGNVPVNLNGQIEIAWIKKQKIKS